ncbi:hypothetical protein FQR65_LT19367 [Abscondita terminalis]|nr:hypothetical protein FQR65_LT19367 [Abscondita terminalis]
MIQGGAGTSMNMNANEVIANRALELMGHQKGEYQFCSPNDHVNLSQSTNDAEAGILIQSFRKKADDLKECKSKWAIPNCRIAVLMTMGQEFNALPYPSGRNAA